MRSENKEGNSTATSVYRILQSPAPICMFYFAHPFGISSPADSSSSSSKPIAAPVKLPRQDAINRKPVPLPAPKYERQPSKAEIIVRQRPESRDNSKKSASNVVCRYESRPSKPSKPENRTGKVKKNKSSLSPTTGVSANETKPVKSKCVGPCATAPQPLSVKPYAKTKKRPNAIERDIRQIQLKPWPSSIWNRDFLIPPLLQVLAKQHGRKIPDIEQILRTVRSAWNTPKSQRSLLQSQDSRESSSSSWDLSSSCDSGNNNNYNNHYHYPFCDQDPRMGAGTYATVMGSGPGLLRRRYSVPEIIMRKHTLTQQKSYDEVPHDSNHNIINVSNKNSYPSPPPYHSPKHRQQQQQQQTKGPTGPMTRGSAAGAVNNGKKFQQSPAAHRKSIMMRASGGGSSGSVEDFGSSSGRPPQLVSTGSESNLASLKRQQQQQPGGISRNQKCSSVNGINSSTHNNNNNNYIGPGGAAGAMGGGAVAGASGTADFSMRKSTLLRRMWSKEMRRYDRSGSWSPPLRRAPRRIYSIESISATTPPSPEVGGGSGGRGNSSRGGSGSESGSSCATPTATSCKECAKLENQYSSGARGGKSVYESPKRLRLAASLNNINNNLQKVDDCVEVLSRTSSPNRNLVSTSEGLLDDSASVTTKSSKAEVSSTTGTNPNTPLIRHNEKVVNDRSKRNLIFMSAGPDTPSTAIDVELDEADLESSDSSSVASQACVRPVGGGITGNTGTILEASEEVTTIDNEPNAEQDEDDDGTSTILNVQDNESDLSEFLQEEAFAGKDDCEDRGQAAAQCNSGANVNVHPRERAKAAGGDAPSRAGAGAVTVNGEVKIESQFPFRKQVTRRGSNASSSAVSISADSTDCESVCNDEIRFNKIASSLAREDILRNEDRLDEYISNLLVDNLNNLVETQEVDTRTTSVNHDKENNNQVPGEEVQSINPTEVNNGQGELGGEMKQKPGGKYIGGGGGVVCNSPPDSANKLKQNGKVDQENEKENEDSINNNNRGGAKVEGKLAINFVRKKNGFGEKQQQNSNGFYLVPKNGSRDSDGLPFEIDLNGKYYFPTYGVETDPSDHTDAASETEAQLVGKTSTTSSNRNKLRGKSTIVPRMSALPRTESMEVQPSSTSAEEEFDDLPRNNGSDSDTPSLVDSLDEVEITPRKRHERKKSLAPPSPGGKSTPVDPTGESGTKSESTSSNKSPRHEKGEAFFVPMKDTTVIINEHIVVADAMPLRIKERLNNRQRLINWRRQQENAKKHRKMMRLIEQKRFYGEPAIHVISTIDRAISRKEYIPPSEKKRVFGQATTTAFTPKVPPKPKKNNSALRTELGMLESYKIDARGNMQIQNASASSNNSSARKATKSPWGQATERRQAKGPADFSAPSTSRSTVTSATTASSKTPKKVPSVDPRRKQVLKDVQQMTLYQQADLTPDIEGGPRRMYQKTEIQEGDKHIEILEIVECGDSASGGYIPRKPPRVRSAGSRSGGNKSRIPVPIYRWGRYRRSNYSRENSPLKSGGSNPKVDRMIADLLMEALSNPDDVGVKFIKTPEDIKDKTRKSPNNGTGRKVAAPSNSNTPRRSANSGKYTQRFEVIPEERSSVSVESSTDELSPGKNKKHASPRRVSFDENHKILNVEEFQPPTATRLSPKMGPSPKPSPKPSPSKKTTTTAATPSPKAPALRKNGTTTTSRGKAAIQSDVVEEKGWIGFSTQHHDEGTTPVNGDEEDEEDVHRLLVTVNHPVETNGNLSANLAANEHDRRSIVKTIITGNTARDTEGKVYSHIEDPSSVHTHSIDHFHHHHHHHHHQSVNINVKHHQSTPVRSVTSVDQVRSTVATVGSRNSRNGATGITTISCNTTELNRVHDNSDNDMLCTLGRYIQNGSGNHLTVATPQNNRKLTSGEFSDESCYTDSLNLKPSPVRSLEARIPREITIPVHFESDIRSSKHGGHTVSELKSTAESVKEVNFNPFCETNDSMHPYCQIREENAWHVYETGDCKVFQSKIEYYETSIHRTPLTENHQSLFGNVADRTPESLRSALIKANFDNHELVPHNSKLEDRLNISSSNTTDSNRIPIIAPLRSSAASEEVPKTSETCSSCCFCNPDLHNSAANPAESCFYCQTKAQTPSKTFPTPPTPPNIQMSPIPPSPKTPITELTPTPTLQEIPLPTKTPQKPPDIFESSTKQTPSSSNPNLNPFSQDSSTNCPPSQESSNASALINGLYTETTKKTDHTHTKIKTKASDTISTKCSTSNEKIKRSYVPSTAETDNLEAVSKKLTRKKSETTVLNRPKHTNNINRATSVVTSIKKEIKNEIKAPLSTKVLPKTAKELNNRKERDKQITLNLPLDKATPSKQEKAKTSLGFETQNKDKPTLACGSSQSYDETSSSCSTDTSPNSSPFKKCAALPPATRWKHNSERNLTQLTMQKIATVSKWGNKWRKAVRHNDPSEPPTPTLLPNETKSPIRMRPSDQRTTTTDTATSAVVGVPPSSAVVGGGITQSTTTSQGWTVTVAGNYNPDMAPDVEMRLSFPKQGNPTGKNALGNGPTGNAGGSGKRNGHGPLLNGHHESGCGYPSGSPSRNRKQYIEDVLNIPGRPNGVGTGSGGQHYTVLDDDGYSVGRGPGRQALPPPPVGFNPKRTLSRAEGNGGGKDYRLPNVGTSNNVTGRQNTKKAIKTMECSVVASATTRTVANKYHMLSHQHQHEPTQHHHLQPQQQPPQHYHQHQSQQQQHKYNLSSSYQPSSSSGVGGPPTSMTTGPTIPGGGGIRGGRPRAMSIQSLHHASSTLQNGAGVSSKYLPPNNAHQPRYHHDPSTLEYGSNMPYGMPGSRRMSLDSQHGGHLDNLSVMGNAIAPELKPKVPTMSERDLTRRHHPCYTRNQPYFS
ncbi:uncharacterized protein LOC129755813 isoform X4 [Uranotaenia lowii]|uniref:uncharacterized protein LOC129755813 isoform X4 n=1 Tax=Uranotaenia lowii TaxID=190385 RepID=UPI0024790ED5|nr:uncharacterized protein LOC129755813 isoform X4 [Uranotaenia lowii]